MMKFWGLYLGLFYGTPSLDSICFPAALLKLSVSGIRGLCSLKIEVDQVSPGPN